MKKSDCLAKAQRRKEPPFVFFATLRLCENRFFHFEFFRHHRLILMVSWLISSVVVTTRAFAE